MVYSFMVQTRPHLTWSTSVELPNTAVWQADFTKQGYSTWNVTVAKRQISAMITPEDLQKFVSWDTSFVSGDFPCATDVLTIHGLSDATVPPYVVRLFLKLI
jgi:hypothetical protein